VFDGAQSPGDGADVRQQQDTLLNCLKQRAPDAEQAVQNAAVG
jgi:hypothetical protein